MVGKVKWILVPRYFRDLMAMFWKLSGKFIVILLVSYPFISNLSVYPQINLSQVLRRVKGQINGLLFPFPQGNWKWQSGDGKILIEGKGNSFNFDFDYVEEILDPSDPEFLLAYPRRFSVHQSQQSKDKYSIMIVLNSTAPTGEILETIDLVSLENVNIPPIMGFNYDSSSKALYFLVSGKLSNEIIKAQPNAERMEYIIRPATRLSSGLGRIALNIVFITGMGN